MTLPSAALNQLTIPQNSSTNWRTHALALAALLVATLIYAWPLLEHLQTAIPGTTTDHDVATMVWNVGWVREALLTGGDLLHSDKVLIPFGADLRMHTYGLLQGLLAYPLTGWLGVVGGFNAVLVATLFLNGATMYALIYAETRNLMAALVAAVWVMFSGPVIFQLAVGRPSFGSIWIVAGCLLALKNLLDQPRIWKGAALGGLLVLALLSDFQMVFYSGLWLVLYSLYRLWQDGRNLIDFRRGVALGVGALVFLLPFMLIFYPALANRAGFQRPALEGMVLFSFRPWDYFTPQTIALVYAYELLGAAIIAPFVLRRRKGYGFWLVSGVFILVLALGPYVQFPSGVTNIPQPFALFSLLSLLSQFRTPYRLAIPAQIGLGVSAGYLLAVLLPRLRSLHLGWALVALAIGLRLVLTINHDPLRVQTYPAYPIYNQIAQEPGDFAILEVPFGVRSGLDRIGKVGDILEFYQSIHGKRLLNGMIARLPTSVFAFYRSHPVLTFLTGEPVAQQDALEADFADVLDWSGVRYVLVHRSLLDSDADTAIEQFLNRQPQLEALGTEDDLMIYRVKEEF